MDATCRGCSRDRPAVPEWSRVAAGVAYALWDGLEVAGLRATADSLPETDVQVAYFGDLVWPNGRWRGRVAVHGRRCKARPQSGILLERWYQAVVEQEPSQGSPPGAMGLGAC